ncbi:MoaD/ThiS family protein [Pseudactinotalea suaedae]|uniref:MoaD/ThiS family protein n=1 Tax=Pseudactinotalea suaedae TaxID=1524924 RepID=UPI0012E16B73|nr:MoaD/ThiS family protein [Pseudactinotalea suaedae]
MTQVRYFAAAAEAAGTPSEAIHAGTLGDLRARMIAAHGPDLERVLARCAVLVDGRRVDDPEAPIADADVVDILPPFAGG